MFSGIGLIGCGLMYDNIHAFSSVSAERNVNIESANDRNALLGIGDTNNSPVDITNNSDSNMNVQLISNDVNFDTTSFDILPSETKSVGFEGKGSVNIEVYSGIQISLEREFKNEVIREIEGYSEGGGENGKFEFRLRSNRSVELTGIRVISIETDNASADVIHNGLSKNERLIDEIDVGEDIGISKLEDPVEINGKSDIFEFNQIRSPDENGNMNTEGAKIELRIEIDNYFNTGITLSDSQT